MRSYYHDEMLFSEIYLEEITQEVETADLLATLKVITEYHDFADKTKTIKSILSDEDSEDGLNLFVPTRARYFIPASPENFHRNNQIKLQFSSKDLFNYVLILISSNVFYWYWRSFGDGFDVATREILDFPIPIVNTQTNEINALATSLLSVIPECKVYKLNGGKLIPNINFNKRLYILQDIDRWICKVLGFEGEINVEIFAQKKTNSFMNYIYSDSDEAEEEE
jgi:hypothetical protein